MEPYIYSVKKNIHIIDLEKTEDLLKKACDFLYGTAKNGGQIIFVGTKKQAREIVEIEAKRCGAFFVVERWLGGTITNYRVIKKNVDKLVELKRKREAGELEKYTKKERLLIDREIEKLEKFVGGIVGLRGIPQILFIVDPRREKTAAHEAKRAGVPIVSLIDTNSDPSGILHLIPGNDDAIKSIAIIVKTVADAVEEGYKDFEKNEQNIQKDIAKKATEEAEKALKITEEALETTDVEADEILDSKLIAKVKVEEPKEVKIEKIGKDVKPEVEDEPKKKKSIKGVTASLAKKEKKVN